MKSQSILQSNKVNRIYWLVKVSHRYRWFFKPTVTKSDQKLDDIIAGSPMRASPQLRLYSSFPFLKSEGDNIAGVLGQAFGRWAEIRILTSERARWKAADGERSVFLSGTSAMALKITDLQGRASAYCLYFNIL